MNSERENPENDKKVNSVHEPEIKYESEMNSASTDSEKLHPILEKLILKSKAESEAGMGIPHEEVMRRLKLKYPFLK